MHRTTIYALALALGFIAATPAPAAACGGAYGEVSEEMRASDPVWLLLEKRDVAKHVKQLEMTLDGDRGRATVRFANEHRLVVAVVKRDGRWHVAS